MKKIFMFVSIFLSLIIAVVIVIMTNISNNKSTLNETYKLAYKTAYKWNKNARVSTVTSVDGEVTETGLGGKRKEWTFIFGDSGTNNGLAILMNDNKVYKTKNIMKPFNENNTIPINDILLNSNEALKKSISVYSLKQGEDWAIGYHYELNKTNGIPTLSVIGLDNSGYFTKISFNSKTKKVIEAAHKIPDGGGIFKNNTGMIIENNKPISGNGIIISPNNAADKTIFTYYYKYPYSNKMSLCISKSQDNGISWLPIKVSDNYLNILFSNNYKKDNIMYLTTPNSVFKSTDLCNNKKLIFKDNSNEIISFSNNKNQLAVLTNQKLNLSNDYGLTWTSSNIPEKSIGVFLNSKNEIYIYTDNCVYKKRSSTWDKILLHLPVDQNISDVIIENDKLIIAEGNVITFYDTNANKYFIKTTSTDIKKLFVANYSKYKEVFYCEKNDDTLSILKYYNASSKFTEDSIKLPLNSVPSNITMDQIGNNYFSFVSKNIWEKIGGKK